MDTGEVEKFFASKPDETPKQPIEVASSLTCWIVFSGSSTASGNAYLDAAVFQDMDDTDLDMLAPYISMDEDFQLTFLPQLPEEEPQTAEVSTTASKKR